MAARRPWLPNECKLAAEIYAAMAPRSPRYAIHRAIAGKLGRSETAVQSQRQARGIKFGHNGPVATLDIDDVAPTGRIGVSARQIADRDARAEAANRRTYTQEFFGDPPPGFSAKDRRL
jgi:hypothetical protein